MLTHILDTSVWIALLLREPEGKLVKGILADPDHYVGISALTLVELHARLREIDRTEEYTDMVDSYRPLFAEILPMDQHVALRANTLREVAQKRIPAIDSMIAATAAVHNAILVHRDPHFRSIPADHLQQLVLTPPQ